MPRTATVPLAPLMPGGGWCRTTRDGIWVLAHEEDDTTSWTVGHLPTKTLVADFLSSLKQCRAYVGSGEAQADLERMQAEAAAKSEINSRKGS